MQGPKQQYAIASPQKLETEIQLNCKLTLEQTCNLLYHLIQNLHAVPIEYMHAWASITSLHQPTTFYY